MANRILRDYTDSDKINVLSFQAECLFIRLMMKADDYGAFHANPKLVNALCYPLKNYEDSEVSAWISELSKNDVIELYKEGKKKFLRIKNFGQRLRQMNRKFPPAPGESADATTEEITEDEVEETPIKTTSTKEAKAKTYKQWKKDDFFKEVSQYVEKYGRETCNKFYKYWTEPSPSGKMRFQLEKTWQTRGRLDTWKSRESKFETKTIVNNSNNSGFSGPQYV